MDTSRIDFGCFNFSNASLSIAANVAARSKRPMASVKIVSLSEAGITDSQVSSGTDTDSDHLDASNHSFLHAENLFFSENK
jgi:hypothetical protein